MADQEVGSAQVRAGKVHNMHVFPMNSKVIAASTKKTKTQVSAKRCIQSYPSLQSAQLRSTSSRTEFRRFFKPHLFNKLTEQRALPSYGRSSTPQLWTIKKYLCTYSNPQQSTFSNIWGWGCHHCWFSKNVYSKASEATEFGAQTQ